MTSTSVRSAAAAPPQAAAPAQAAAQALVPSPAQGPSQAPVFALRDPVFISDLHLAAARPRTLARFLAFLDELAPGTELLVLGDLFEYWAGDDELAADPAVDTAAEGVGARVAAALRATGGRGIAVHLMHGNRDLLLAQDFAAAAGAQLLPDPCLAEFGGERLLLSHGDAWCTLDTDYQRWRAQARNPGFQRMFLAQPLAQRRQLLGQARQRSEAGKQAKPMQIMDVTPAAVDDALRAASAGTVIHGHPHRPARHDFMLDGAAAVRWVLADWDFDAEVCRGNCLRRVDGGLALVDLPPG